MSSKLPDKPKKVGGKRPGSGRPEIKVLPRKNPLNTDAIPMDILEAFCQIGCTQEDIAAYFHISKRTLINIRKKNPDVREAMNNAFLRGKMSLRRKLWERAIKGDAAAMIFLGKAVLGYSDRVDIRQEVSGPGGKPVEIKTTTDNTAILNEFLDLVEQQKLQQGNDPVATAPEADSKERP